LLETRKKTNMDYWLIHSSYLEILQSINSIDFDDDIFIYDNVNNNNNYEQIIIVKEIYRLDKFESLTYGNWTTKKGLIVKPDSKFIRRKDLKVFNLISKLKTLSNEISPKHSFI
jgi:hypothetical protein